MDLLPGKDLRGTRPLLLLPVGSSAFDSAGTARLRQKQLPSPAAVALPQLRLTTALSFRLLHRLRKIR